MRFRARGSPVAQGQQRGFHQASVHSKAAPASASLVAHLLRSRTSICREFMSERPEEQAIFPLESQARPLVSWALPPRGKLSPTSQVDGGSCRFVALPCHLQGACLPLRTAVLRDNPAHAAAGEQIDDGRAANPSLDAAMPSDVRNPQTVKGIVCEIALVPILEHRSQAPSGAGAPRATVHALQAHRCASSSRRGRARSPGSVRGRALREHV